MLFNLSNNGLDERRLDQFHFSMCVGIENPGIKCMNKSTHLILIEVGRRLEFHHLGEQEAKSNVFIAPPVGFAGVSAVKLCHWEGLGFGVQGLGFLPVI